MHLTRGSSKLSLVLVLTLVGLAGLALLWFASQNRSWQATERLVVHAAAGTRIPMEQLAAGYEELHGVRIQLNYGGSGALLGALKVRPRGDIYIAADSSYVEKAQGFGIVRELVPLASMVPVLAVPTGNPKGLRSLADLERADLRVALAEPDVAAVGQIARQALQSSGRWEAVRTSIKVTKPTEPELAADLELGAVDVSILWSSTVKQRPKLEAVHDADLDRFPRRITGGVLEQSTASAEALRFLRFASSSDRGATIFEAAGFNTLDNGPYDDAPHLVLFSGAMLHGAVEQRITAFAEREGVRIDTVYNGCGILVSQMRAGAEVDAYFACDNSFMDMVQERFEASTVVSASPVVLLVAKGNPQGLAELEDLCRADLRVGLAHPENSALGSLTQGLLERANLTERLQSSGNVKVESPTGDYLVNQLRVGALDVAVVYASNAAMALEEVERVPLDLPGALALQPFAAAKSTQHPLVLARLLAELTSDASKARFEELGFQWQVQ
ncbi:MAG: molybdate transport system substrate-binding protein [Planctomycetota bacterium]|jgi:molybdate transport system substrate-binding protein